MNYLAMTATENMVTIKTQKGSLVKLPEYKGPRGENYYFDFCYFGSLNFDVYKVTQKGDRSVARDVDASSLYE